VIITTIKNLFEDKDKVRLLRDLYGKQSGSLVYQLERFTDLLKKHDAFSSRAADPRIFSAPGRIEIIGNHTDHNNGKVLAAAITFDTIAAVTLNDGGTVRLQSEYGDKYVKVEVPLDNLGASGSYEKNTVRAIAVGALDIMRKRGVKLRGFDATLKSDVAGGSGLSSSAAFEVLLLLIVDALFSEDSGAERLSAVERAELAQQIENNYYGKPSGLMDQMASSVGGLVAIDFIGSPANVQPLHFDLEANGYSVVIVKPGGDHAGLTEHYAAIPHEMKQVASFFGKNVLREVDYGDIIKSVPTLRQSVSERAILRALHYFDENFRVGCAIAAVANNNVHDFIGLVNESGDSSWELLQNISAFPNKQPIAIALTLARRALSGNGAVRVMGGGFAGSILCLVRNERLPAFVESMSAAFGDHSVDVLDIRQAGACEIPL
jgi:galactokinase